MMNIEIRGAGKQFIRKRGDSNCFWAVEKTDWKLEGGKITALYGASGSGKSTLLSMLAGILKPTEGQVLLDGTELYHKADKELSRFRAKHIGVIPQGQTAIQSLTVLENVLLPSLFSQGMDREASEAEISERAAELLKKLGIEELQNIMPRELSGGELRRMAVARALLLEPDVVLADEPTADLDPENTELVLQCLKREAENGKVVLIVTHDSQVMKYADEVFYMKKGKIGSALEI